MDKLRLPVVSQARVQQIKKSPIGRELGRWKVCYCVATGLTIVFSITSVTSVKA
jgi:hypothetical protein